MKFKTGILAVALTAAPLLTFAIQLLQVCDFANLLSMFVNVFAFIVFVLAVAAILYSGFLFLTAGGSDAKVESARNALIWGLIGIAVALFATYAIDFVINVVGGSKMGSCSFSNVKI